jgi:hypothetical protein
MTDEIEITPADRDDFRIEIACVESVIENEIKQSCNQRQIAQTYRLGLESSWPTDWAKVNAMILAKWPKGLTRVKEMAWSGKCFATSKNTKEPRA